jgi:16S rRNA (adenine1518-N6/adenine1519-N6)-dimethyltransferase
VSQLTLQQLREFGISPDTNLGQHFLVDDNILGVIERLSDLTSDDVVYEPGAGVGVLTEFLATRVSHVHAVEIDRRLDAPLAHLTERHANLNLIWGDAVDVRPQELEPAPTKLASNLPYHVAAPIIAETLQHAPQIGTFCVMIQREVADRLFAGVGDKNYGGISVLVQALCQRTGVHKVSRSAFVPMPNVDSTLLAFARSDVVVADIPKFAAFVKRCFLHRRKTLSNNLQSAGFTRDAIAAMLESAGLAANIRPQNVTPEQFIHLAETA